MTNITMFNSLIRQLLIQLGDEEGTALIRAALGAERQIKVLRALSFNDKTVPQLHESTGIGINYLYRVISKLAKLGVIEVKRTIPNSTPEKGGKEKNVYGLV